MRWACASRARTFTPTVTRSPARRRGNVCSSTICRPTLRQLVHAGGRVSSITQDSICAANCGNLGSSWLIPSRNEVAMNPIEQNDPEVWQAIAGERLRQQAGLEMIASENYTSPAVLAAQGSVLTNKYAEGYPGRRYYGGCEFVDVVERLAIDRVRKLFGAEHANVQPHSGAQANMAVYFTCLEPGDT